MHQLDPTDKKILALLQQDASLDVKQIAVRVHKSISPTHQRIKRLREEGFIQRYVAVLDREKIGKPLLAVTQVSLSVHTQKVLNDFAEQMNQLPEVQLCLHLSGACDFILHIAVANATAYGELLMNKICCNPQVVHVDTSFVLRECKAHSPYVL